MKGTNKAYEIIRARLVGGHYTPGAQLKEVPLASELGLSRTPVRSALKQLVEDGLASSDNKQGIRASEWTEFDIEETFQLRMLLEPYAASLAATRGDDRLPALLHTSNAAMKVAIEANDIEGIQTANRDFHNALIDASGSPKLRGILKTMIDMPIIVRSFHLSSTAENWQSLHHHEELTLAVDAHDGDLARQVMHLHLRIAYLRFMSHRNEYQTAAQTNKRS
jgi:DNA-binding GntR family transcriptional regulator